MSNQTYLFVSSVGKFEESVGLVSCTFMELDKKSENGRLYRFEDAEQIIETLIGSPIRYGINWLGKHLEGSETREVGFVESAELIGKKVVGSIRITSKDILSKIKSGVKFLLSVGGKAGMVLKKGFVEMINPKVEHVQLFPTSQGEAGFSSAKVEKILEIEESVLYAGSNTLALLTALELI